MGGHNSAHSRKRWRGRREKSGGQKAKTPSRELRSVSRKALRSQLPVWVPPARVTGQALGSEPSPDRKGLQGSTKQQRKPVRLMGGQTPRAGPRAQSTQRMQGLCPESRSRAYLGHHTPHLVRGPDKPLTQQGPETLSAVLIPTGYEVVPFSGGPASRSGAGFPGRAKGRVEPGWGPESEPVPAQPPGKAAKAGRTSNVFRLFYFILHKWRQKLVSYVVLCFPSRHITPSSCHSGWSLDGRGGEGRGLQLPLLTQSQLQGQPQHLNLALGDTFSSPTPLSLCEVGQVTQTPEPVYLPENGRPARCFP